MTSHDATRAVGRNTLPLWRRGRGSSNALHGTLFHRFDPDEVDSTHIWSFGALLPLRFSRKLGSLTQMSGSGQAYADSISTQ